MTEDSPLRRKIEAGTPVLGTWNTLGSPLVTECMARAGFDFQVVDLEHGPFVLDEVHLHVSACEASGTCSPVVRIPSNEAWMALQALDQGAHGVMVPHVASGDDARSLADSIRYHPLGGRGFTPFSKAGRFGTGPVEDHVESSNRTVLGLVVVESLEGLESVEEIAATPGIDVVYFGAYDLSQALGRPGQPMHPLVVEAISEGVEKVRRAGACPGGFVPRSQEEVAWLLDLGMGFITYGVDSWLLADRVGDMAGWFVDRVG